MPVNILLVDDNERVIKGLRELISLIENIDKIYTAINANQAEEIVRSTKVDLIVLDYLMPGITGLELAEKIHEIDPHINIVMLSIIDRKANQDILNRYGIVKWFTKSENVGHLLSFLSELASKSDLGKS